MHDGVGGVSSGSRSSLLVVLSGLDERVVVAHLATAVDGLSRLDEFDRLGILGGLGVFVSPPTLILGISGGITLQVPRVVHHESKVVIVIDRARDVLVIFSELIESNSAIRLRVLSHVEVGLKGLQELDEDLVLGALSCEYVGVLVSFV